MPGKVFDMARGFSLTQDFGIAVDDAKAGEYVTTILLHNAHVSRTRKRKRKPKLESKHTKRKIVL